MIMLQIKSKNCSPGFAQMARRARANIDARSRKNDGRSAGEELVTCTGPLVVAVPVSLPLAPAEEEVAAPCALLVPPAPGLDVGVGVLLPGAGAEEIGATDVCVFALCCVWLVTWAMTVDDGGRVSVATTSLLVSGKGLTTSVLVAAATMDCAVCTEQKSMKGLNSGST